MASIQYVVNATDLASAVFAKIAASADGLDKQLEDLSKRVATPEVDLKDTAFTAGMLRVAERIDKLSAMMAEPGVDLSDKKFQTEIFKINAQLDRLDKRHVTATVNVKTDRSFLSRIGGLFGGGGGGGGDAIGQGGRAGGGIAALLSGATPVAAQGIGIAAIAAAAAATLPALLPTALGLLTGGGAAGGAFLLGSAANKQLVALQKSLASAKGPAKAPIQAQIKALQQTSGPELSIFGAFQDLGAQMKGAFAGALKAPGPGFSAGGGQPGAPSFLTSLTGILKQLGSFAKTLQPVLADLFRASVPYLKLFVGFLEQAAKILLPVFTAALKQMTPFLPLMAAGLLNIIQGLAGMIKALGPGGMKASAEIFVGLCRAMEFVLIGVGHAADWLAKAIMIAAHAIVVAWHWLIPAFEAFRHRTAVVFDGVRHDIAHVWDQIFQNSIGMVIRLVHNVETQYNSLRHGIAATFDGARHDIAHAWDVIWNNTVGRVQRGIADVVRWFKGLPGKVINALMGLGTALYNFGHMMFEKFWNGMKAAWHFVAAWVSRIGGWIKNLKGPIGKDLNLLYDEGRAIMHGLGRGIKHGFSTYVSRQLGAAGAGVQRWAGLVRRALAMEGLSPGLLGNVLFQMSTESGGNPNAINLNDINAQMGDPSRGLMQTIMSTFQAYHWPGTSNNIYDPLANIAAALNYARHVYGPSLMSGGMGIGSGKGYAAGSWNVPYTGPAVVHQGEMIIPASRAAAIRSGSSGALVHIDNFNSYDATDTVLLGQRVSWAVVSAGLGS